MNMNTNNINIIKNDYKDIIIDKRILPLFKTPVILKKLSDKKRNKYNIKLLDHNTKSNFKLITIKDILEIFLKGINLYNYNLNKYLTTHNNQELILQLKNDDNYKLNISLSNFRYLTKKIFPIFKLRSLLYKIRLFFPKRLLKPEPHIRFSYRFRFIAKIYRDELIYKNKRDRKIYRRQIKKLVIKGKEILKELDEHINIKTQLISKLNVNNKNNFNITDNFISTISTVKSKFTNKSSLLNTTNFDKSKSKSKSKTKTKSISKSNVNRTQKETLKQSFNYILDAKINNTFERVKKNTQQWLLNDNKLLINKVFFGFNINKTNELKIEQTMKSILKNNAFEGRSEAISINSNPVDMLYSNYINKSTVFYNNNLQNKPIINQYLKSMSHFNMIKKGIFMSYSNIMGFHFNTESNKLIKNIYNLLAGSFKSMYCLISKPVFISTPDKIIIQLFYFLFIPNILKFKKIFKYGNSHKLSKQNWFKRQKRIKKQYRNFRKLKINVRIKLRNLSNVVVTKVFKVKIKKLCELLSHLFKKPVHLDLIRLHYPYNDSNILVNLLGIMINKMKLRIMFRKLFEKAVIKNLNKVKGKTKFNIIPAFLSGINIRVAGRLLTQRVIPRKTVKTIRRGAAATGKINLSDVARYTNKNKRGSFSITVSSGQNFF